MSRSSTTVRKATESIFNFIKTSRIRIPSVYADFFSLKIRVKYTPKKRFFQAVTPLKTVLFYICFIKTSALFFISSVFSIYLSGLKLLFPLAFTAIASISTNQVGRQIEPRTITLAVSAERRLDITFSTAARSAGSRR